MSQLHSQLCGLIQAGGCPEGAGLDSGRGLVRKAALTRLGSGQAEPSVALGTGRGRVLLEMDSSRRSDRRWNSAPTPAAAAVTPSEMPQHSMGDKHFVSMPQLVFPGLPLATNSECDCTPPSRRASLGSPLSQPLCQPLPEKRGPRAAREVRYVATGRPDQACGWRAFAPTCLQAFNTPRGFLLFLCAASFLQGMTVNGFINTVITSIERRYDLHSYQSGLIASSYDVAACLCLTFVSYFGGHGHKPRWLGWGVLLMGAGSLVFSLPHFTTGPYEAQVDEAVGTCRANRSATCGGRASGLSSYQLVFMLGQFLHGMGATPLYTLGVTYLDENVKSSYSPVYIGEWGGCDGGDASRPSAQSPAPSKPPTCMSLLATRGSKWPQVLLGEVTGQHGPASHLTPQVMEVVLAGLSPIPGMSHGVWSARTLVVLWLGLCASAAGGPGLIPGRGTKTPRAGLGWWLGCRAGCCHAAPGGRARASSCPRDPLVHLG